MAQTENTNPSPVTYKDNDGNVIGEITIKNSIPFTEVCACIHNIVNGVIDDSGYYPYLRDVVYYGNILEMFSDFDVSIGYEKLDELLRETDLSKVVDKNIAHHQISMILHSTNQLIEYKKQHSIKSEFDVMCSNISSLIKKLDGMLNIDPDTIQKVMGNFANMNVSEKGLIEALVGTVKGGKGKSKSAKKDKDNVVELPPVGQQKFDGTEVLE